MLASVFMQGPIGARIHGMLLYVQGLLAQLTQLHIFRGAMENCIVVMS